MIVFPNNYKEIYPCINQTGFTADIYTDKNRSEAYKIYRSGFDYKEDKFNHLKQMSNKNCTSPLDEISLEKQRDLPIGYLMKYDDGIVLAYLQDANMIELMGATDDYLETLREISYYKCLISDPNINNISFKQTFRFLDVYSFTWAQKISENKIYDRNLNKINETILCGIIDFDYKRKIRTYLAQKHSKYLEAYLALDKESPIFVPDILSILMEETKEQSIKSAREKIMTIGNR
ncbi:MAG: hypothetical protein HFG40_04080 [Bacilli bacterium]|nr:hypothetical protein [Bacilli bacterium]